jgi:hypothetical protein
VRAQAVTNGRVSSGEHREDVGGNVRHAGDGVHGGARAGAALRGRTACVQAIHVRGVRGRLHLGDGGQRRCARAFPEYEQPLIDAVLYQCIFSTVKLRGNFFRSCRVTRARTHRINWGTATSQPRPLSSAKIKCLLHLIVHGWWWLNQMFCPKRLAVTGPKATSNCSLISSNEDE